MSDAKRTVGNAIDHSLKAIESIRGRADEIIHAANIAVSVIESGGKIFFAGNGGSAADSQHAAAELIGRLGLGVDRRPLPAIALTTDTSALTAIANDFGFEEIFARQLSALGNEGDLLIAISTGGASSNILRAVEAANEMGIRTVALTGPGDSPLSKISEITIRIDATNTPRIQEGHGAIIHILCELIEKEFAK